MRKIIYPVFMAMLILKACSYASEDDYAYGVAYYPDVYDENYNQDGQQITENPFVLTSETDTSTFSIDTDGASYARTRLQLNSGYQPDADEIRTEELINYFIYDYAEGTDPVSMNSEITACPWQEGNYLMRIGLRGKSLTEQPASNYVYLIDVSGSMSGDDKIGILKQGLLQYVDQMTENDRISIVVYAGNAKVLLEGASVSNDKTKILKTINGLSAGGSTNGEAGIEDAYNIAKQYFIEGGNNRIILGTDGDFNVGISSQDALVDLIEEKRETGVYLTILGVGSYLNESGMEQMANHGNGNFEFLDNADELNKVFFYDYGKFFTVAKDVKTQVIFDSTKVESYRLIGYENRLLQNGDFTDDTKDAGELGAGQNVTALYEIVPKQQVALGENFATISLRYKSASNDQTIFQQSYSASITSSGFQDASENTRFAAGVAGFGLLLRDSQYKGTLTWDDMMEWHSNAKSYDPHGLKVAHSNVLNRAAQYQ